MLTRGRGRKVTLGGEWMGVANVHQLLRVVKE